jgi:hypothetical protein
MDGIRKAVRQDMFILEVDDGETWTIPGTNSSIRRRARRESRHSESDTISTGFVADDKTAPFAVLHSRGMVGGRPKNLHLPELMLNAAR